MLDELVATAAETEFLWSLGRTEATNGSPLDSPTLALKGGLDLKSVPATTAKFLKLEPSKLQSGRNFSPASIAFSLAPSARFSSFCQGGIKDSENTS